MTDLEQVRSQLVKLLTALLCFGLFLPTQVIATHAAPSDKCLALSNSQYFEAGSKLIPLERDFTVEFDFYLSKDSVNYGEIMSQGGQPNGFYFGVDPSLTIRAGDTWSDTGVKMPVKKWTHFALTHSASGDGTLYVDGVNVGTRKNYVLNQEGTKFRLGAQYDSGANERINGCIDNLMIWRSVRTVAQVKTDMQVLSLNDGYLEESYNFNSLDSSGNVPNSNDAVNPLHPFIEAELLPVSDPVPARAASFNSQGGILGSTAPTGGPGFYVTANFQGGPIPDGYRSGFGWYSTLWPLTETQVDNFQLGLSSTWIVPNNPDVSASTAQQLCKTGTDTWVRNAASNPNNGTYGLFLFQTLEGSLGWWGNEKFRTVFPKYMANATQNCYSSELATPGWGFFRDQPTPRSGTGLIQISNQIIMPPDGMTFKEDLTAPQLGITWHSLTLPRFDHAFGSNAGSNSWTLFMNTSNFKGPLVFVAPQFWADGAIGNPTQKGLSLDTKSGQVGGLASEWNSIPYYKYLDSDGKVYTKIPQLQYPVDSNGDFAISRDFSAYANNAVNLDSQNAPSGTATYKVKLDGTSPLAYQEGKTLQSVSDLVAAKTLDAGTAYGFSAPGKTGLVKLPQYFLETGGAKIEIPAAQAPASLVKASFGNPKVKSSFVYQYPSWWDASPKASEDLTTKLNDGSTAIYRWYKFVDQPALQRFELNDSEKMALQASIVKMQKDWAHSPQMAEPSKGSLAAFDSGLMVTPPKGLEFGYVPIVVKQFIDTNTSVPTVEPTVKPSPTTSSPTVIKKSTITCIKGKLVKKVTAVKPACPKGYKKK